MASISSLAAKRECKITKSYIGTDYAVGLDEKPEYFYFFRKSAEGEKSVVVKLGDIQHCKVVTTYRAANGKTGGASIIDKLELRFIPVSKSRQEIDLEFFESGSHGQLSGELQAIEEWSKILNGRIPVGKQIEKTL